MKYDSKKIILMNELLSNRISVRNVPENTFESETFKKNLTVKGIQINKESIDRHNGVVDFIAITVQEFDSDAKNYLCSFARKN